MKAWICRDAYEEHACVVFHNHGLAARRLGSNEFDGDFNSTKCERAPQYDEYAELGYVPQKVRLADGWWFECFHCSERVSDDYLYDRGLTIKDVIEVGRDTVYCNAACKQAYEDYKNHINERHQKYITKLRALYPQIELYEKEGIYSSNKYSSYTCTLFVDFPGMKHAPANLRVDDVRQDKAKPVWHCCYGDQEAFKTWLDSLPKAVLHD